MTAYARLRPLTEPRGRDIGDAFRQLARNLADTGERASVQLTVLGEAEPRHWTLDVRAKDARLKAEAAREPDTQVVTREATWWEISEGRLSPLEAFAQGRLRVLGDTALGTRLLRRVAGEGKTSICGE